jgi:hypothetical protein
LVRKKEFVGDTKTFLRGLNQDVAENTFSQIRGIGCSHPGPVDCANRLRLIMLGKNGQVVVENPSVSMIAESPGTPVFDTEPVLLQSLTSAISPDLSE